MKFPPTLGMALGIAVVWTACATPGPPLPPTLDLPRPVMDLTAVRQGDNAVLTWTQPAETTDKLRIRRPGRTAICRKLIANAAEAPPANSAAPQACEPIVATILPAASSAASDSSSARPGRVTYRAAIPADASRQYPQGVAVFYVEPLNDSGRGAGFSNPVAVPLAPAPPVPQDVKAVVTKKAIVIHWSPVEVEAGNGWRLAGFRVERALKNAKGPDERLFVAYDSPANGGLEDTQFAWDKTYDFRVAAVTGVFDASGNQTAEVQGDWSSTAEVVTRDIFPPAQPSGLQAVFTALGSQRFIDLTWLPVTELDLAGYHIFRRTEGSPAERIDAQLVKAPAFRDADILPGRRYVYSVSAVDQHGNESPRSAETSEATPP